MTISPASYTSSHSSTSFYPSSCSSISPPRTYPVSSQRRSHQPQPYDFRARDHLASLTATPVLSTSSLRKLTSTSPVTSPRLPLDTPPASPTAVEAPYVSTSGTQPIPIPRANCNRCLDDLPLTPLTARFDQAHFFPPAEQSSQSPSRNARPARKKKSRAAQSSSSSKTMQTSHGPSLGMSSQSGHPLSPKRSPKPSPLHLGNLPRFHPAVYESSNRSSNNPPQQRSHGYRVSSGGSRDALRQYRELIAASVAPPSSASPTSFSKPSAPRLDPLGSPGPVTPLTLEEADSYMAAGSASKDDSSRNHQEERLSERDERFVSPRSDSKGR
ncbi:hypothetical protein VTN77DRAFT_1982 [Rasamsonia byssochlamydoides]|uniref:uncharacterized protein n=1 Tax=Rasamsonia byssochlamydoides TaxID=89139 RepID=UPI0037434C08